MGNKAAAPLRVILTGATGMIGEGVLHECLRHESVARVAVLTRRPCGITHPKLEELLLPDFMNMTALESRLTGYNACFFCSGVSSIGLNESEFSRLTHTLTLHVAGTLCRLNPGMTFCYVSGAGTDHTEKGRMMWARVKGKTENDLLRLSFRRVFNFRPAFLKPTPGMKHTLRAYRYLGWLIPVMRIATPKYICSLKEMGIAMIRVSLNGYDRPTIEVPDMRRLAGTLND